MIEHHVGEGKINAQNGSNKPVSLLLRKHRRKNNEEEVSMDFSCRHQCREKSRKCSVLCTVGDSTSYTLQEILRPRDRGHNINSS